MEELLRLEWIGKPGHESVRTLDEFLIREMRDWLFTSFDDLGMREAKYLRTDPIHEGNKKFFRESSLQPPLAFTHYGIRDRLEVWKN